MRPYTLHTISSTKYILTVIDDFSRATWTFLLRDKTKTFDTLHDFIMMAQNQF